MDSGHNWLVGSTGLHGNVLCKRCGEANEGLLATIKTSYPPGVDGAQALCGNAITRVWVVIINRLQATTKVQLYVLLYQARVKRTEMILLVIYTKQTLFNIHLNKNSKVSREIGDFVLRLLRKVCFHGTIVIREYRESGVSQSNKLFHLQGRKTVVNCKLLWIDVTSYATTTRRIVCLKFVSKHSRSPDSMQIFHAALCSVLPGVLNII